MKTVAIIQSNYIPWKGYFDIIHAVDEFILYDDAQYTRRDWRNRNLVKSPKGPQWLTIPLKVKGGFEEKIRNMCISDPSWAGSHWATLRHLYAKAPCFRQHAALVESWYELAAREEYLSRINYLFLRQISDFLGIRTPITWSMDYPATGERSELLVGLCRAAGAGRYLSGPAAKSYLEPERFAEAGIEVAWQSYEGYPPYEQRFPPFEHGVSILDMIFNLGTEAPHYIWGWRTDSQPGGA